MSDYVRALLWDPVIHLSVAVTLLGLGGLAHVIWGWDACARARRWRQISRTIPPLGT